MRCITILKMRSQAFIARKGPSWRLNQAVWAHSPCLTRCSFCGTVVVLQCFDFLKELWEISCDPSYFPYVHKCKDVPGRETFRSQGQRAEAEGELQLCFLLPVFLPLGPCAGNSEIWSTRKPLCLNLYVELRVWLMLFLPNELAARRVLEHGEVGRVESYWRRERKGKGSWMGSDWVGPGEATWTSLASTVWTWDYTVTLHVTVPCPLS